MVSLIVPVYNAEKYLEKCVNSICAQTYHDIEVILIDDGSSDQSLKEAQRLSKIDNRIKVYCHENRGAAYTRNRGMELASGDYIQFVDADDYIDCEMTQKMLKQLQTLDLDLCICDFDFLEKKKRKNELSEFAEAIRGGFFNHFVELMKNSLLQGPCNKLYKASIIKENNISFPIEYSKLEDSIFNARYLLFCKKVGFIPQALYFYNTSNQDSLSKALNPKEINAMALFYKTLLGCFKDDDNNINDKKIVLSYAIEQLEVAFRVNWIRSKDTAGIPHIWSIFNKDIQNQKMLEMLRPYIGGCGIRYRLFFRMLENQNFKLMKMYFKIIELIKHILK